MYVQYIIPYRKGLLKFLLGCHTSEGAFRMHHDGEVDIRWDIFLLDCKTKTLGQQNYVYIHVDDISQESVCLSLFS